MSEKLPACPECESDLTYEQPPLLACPMCGHEWSAEADLENAVVRDAFGTPLADGDSVTVVKDLKVKGSSSIVKIGTKVRSIRLIDGVGDHNIDCKIDGIGQMQLKSSVVKKA